MKSTGSTRSLLSALVLVFLSFICMGNAFKQELWFYDAQDNGLHFQSHVADTSHFTSFLPYVTRVCTRGLWDLYSTVNFLTYYNNPGLFQSSGVVCENFTTAASVKSLRFEGAKDTDIDALSLYEGDSSGKEVFITGRARAGITNRIITVAITGASEWLLFEGMNFDGKSTCHKRLSGFYVYPSYVSSLNLDTIGSVFKGCDLQNIQNYKTLQAL